MEHCLLSTQCFLISVKNVQARYNLKQFSFKIIHIFEIAFCMHAQIVESFFFYKHMYYVGTYSSNLEIY